MIFLETKNVPVLWIQRHTEIESYLPRYILDSYPVDIPMPSLILNEAGYLVDGYNRLEYAIKHNFRTVPVDYYVFNDGLEMKAYAIDVHLNRRNLSPNDQKKYKIEHDKIKKQWATIKQIHEDGIPRNRCMIEKFYIGGDIMIIVTEYDKTKWIDLKKICEIVGVKYGNQSAKLKRNKTIPIERFQFDETARCGIPLDSLDVWLDTIPGKTEEKEFLHTMLQYIEKHQ